MKQPVAVWYLSIWVTMITARCCT